MKKCDLLVLGSGPSSLTVAMDAASKNKKIILVEKNDLGGTCALRGCNPKKVYTNAGDLLNRVRSANGKLVEIPEANINWKKLHDFKEEFTSGVPKNRKKSLENEGIEVITGSAHFVRKNVAVVNGIEIQAEKVFIGVGAKPRELKFEGSEFVIDNSGFFNLEKLPEKITFIGAGYVTMEFAHVLARYGVSVTIIERGDRPLKQFDADIVSIIKNVSKDIGIQFVFNAKIQKICKTEGSYEIFYKKEDKSSSLKSDLVIHGAGRTPQLKELSLEMADVSYGEKGIKVDKYMRSVSNAIFFAGGDCANNGKPNLTPVASLEARAVNENIFSESPESIPSYKSIPSIVFTSPCLATIGVSEKDVDKNDVDIFFDDTSNKGTVRKLGFEYSAHKVIVCRKTNEILGAHLVGPAAEEVINMFALAINNKITSDGIKETMLAFPTFGSEIKGMLSD